MVWIVVERVRVRASGCKLQDLASRVEKHGGGRLKDSVISHRAMNDPSTTILVLYHESLNHATFIQRTR